MIPLLVALALAKPPTTEAEAKAAQEAWVTYATHATAEVWPDFETRLRTIDLPSGEYAWSARMVVDPEGKLVQVTLSKASGIEDADAALISAFRKVDGFGPPPEVWVQSTDEAVFDVTFTYATAKGSSGVIEVPFEK